MSELVKFSIDKLEIIESANKSQFAKARVDFFASGNNSHNMPMSADNLRKYADTILGKPLVYIIEKGWFRKEDFSGHDSEEKPLGYFSENGEIQFRDIGEGRIMASAVALIWKKYADKAMKIFARDNATKPVSVEMQIFTMDEKENGEKEIVDFAFTGCTVLGTDVLPAIKEASMEIFEFSQAKKEYESQLSKYSSIDFSIPKQIQEKIQLTLLKAKEEDINILPTALIKANYIIKNKSISPEKVQSFVQFFQKHKDDNSFILCGGEESKNWFNFIHSEIQKADQLCFSKTETKEDLIMVNYQETEKDEKKEEFTTDTNVEGVAAVARSEEETEGDKEAVDEKEDFEAEKKEEFEEKETPEEEKAEGEKEEDTNAQMSCLKAEMAKLQENFASLEKETFELREFKATVLNAQKKSTVEFALLEVSEVMPKEKIEDWRERANTAEFSSVDVWANAVKADAFTYVSKQKPQTENFTRMALPNVSEKQKDVKKSIWAD